MRFEDIETRLDALEYWIRERHRIWQLSKLDRKPKPWTKDPIFQKYRFCNVHREKDKVTQLIAAMYRTAERRASPDLWFAYCVARLINWPETLVVLGWPVPWDPKKFLTALQRAEAQNGKVWGGAYIVSTNGREMPKPQYIAAEVLSPLWEARAKLRPQDGETLASYHAKLSQHNGMGSFMAAQVIADLKHAVGTPLYHAEDRDEWAASGPGSRRGLNRVLGYPVDDPWREKDWFNRFTEVRWEMNERLAKKFATDVTLKEIEGQDYQNCLCEFDKYVRARTGEGRPRTLYDGLPADDE